ncbi:hypothetical protein U0070_023651 [Myodes glareolus]|uniref:Uncharacterized protein n=1 Tax=Myodes glareolus TaxID=447135 RepID=A0AAW0IPK1_MYOGA
MLQCTDCCVGPYCVSSLSIECRVSSRPLSALISVDAEVQGVSPSFVCTHQCGC